MADLRIPTVRIGNVLDAGKASKAAIKLLAIEALERPIAEAAGQDYALNNRRCHRKWKVSDRTFRAGIKHLVDRAGLQRQQVRKGSYARQTFEDNSGRGGYVRVPEPEKLLQLDEAVVAFVVVALASPGWSRPSAICRRFGITSREAQMRLVAAVDGTGWLEVRRGPRGAVLIAQPGTSVPVATGSMHFA